MQAILSISCGGIGAYVYIVGDKAYVYIVGISEGSVGYPICIICMCGSEERGLMGSTTCVGSTI